MLIRHREAGEKNLLIIERLFEKLLSIPRLVDVDNKQGKADEEPLFDEDDYCISDEDGEEEDESPQENKSMDIDDDALPSSPKDLSSKEINTLLSVSVMLSECEGNEDIIADMVKDKLHSNYKDMEDSDYQYMADLVNLVGKFSCKNNETPSIFTGVFSRQVRNILVQKYSKFTRFNTVSMSVNISEKNKGEKIAIDLTVISRYLLFKPNCKIFKDFARTEEFTSYDSTKNPTTKETVFRNFFQVGKITKILKEQHLEPNWAFSSADQYNLNFLGKKRKNKMKEATKLQAINNQESMLSTSAAAPAIDENDKEEVENLTIQLKDMKND